MTETIIQSGVVSHHTARNYASAAGVNMLLFEVWPVGTPFRETDPCGYGAPGGGGSGPSGPGPGGSGGLDDDGAAQKSFSGPLVIGPVESACSGSPDGIKITQFHLADRNEGGLGGKSEVYIHATFYRSDDPPHSRVLDNNTNIETFPCTDSAPYGWNISKGRKLTEVDPMFIRTDVNTIGTIHPDQQVLIAGGFCADPVSGPDLWSYDRLYITIFERDGLRGRIDNFQNQDLPKSVVGECPTHWQAMYWDSDIWFSNENFRITYEDFSLHGNVIYLTEIPGGYEKRFTMPGAGVSWFKLELY